MTDQSSAPPAGATSAGNVSPGTAAPPGVRARDERPPMVVLSVGEAADRAGRDKRTIRRWLEGGKIPGAVRSATQPNQPWRIPQTGLDAYLSAIDEVPVDRAPSAPSAPSATLSPAPSDTTETQGGEPPGATGGPAAIDGGTTPPGAVEEDIGAPGPQVGQGAGATPVPPPQTPGSLGVRPAPEAAPPGEMIEALQAAARAEGRDELRVELDEARRRVADLQVELEGSRRDISTAGSAEKRLTAERDGARRDLEEARAQRQRMAVDLEKLSERSRVIQTSHDNTIAAHSAELERLLALHAETRHDLEVARAEAAEARAKPKPWYRRR